MNIDKKIKNMDSKKRKILKGFAKEDGLTLKKYLENLYNSSNQKSIIVRNSIVGNITQVN